MKNLSGKKNIVCSWKFIEFANSKHFSFLSITKLELLTDRRPVSQFYSYRDSRLTFPPFPLFAFFS